MEPQDPTRPSTLRPHPPSPQPPGCQPANTQLQCNSPVAHEPQPTMPKNLLALDLQYVNQSNFNLPPPLQIVLILLFNIMLANKNKTDLLTKDFRTALEDFLSDNPDIEFMELSTQFNITKKQFKYYRSKVNQANRSESKINKQKSILINYLKNNSNLTYATVLTQFSKLSKYLFKQYKQTITGLSDLLTRDLDTIINEQNYKTLTIYINQFRARINDYRNTSCQVIIYYTKRTNFNFVRQKRYYLYRNKMQSQTPLLL